MIEIIHHETIVMDSRLPFQFGAVGSMRADHRRRLVAPFQKRQIEQPIDHHPRAAGEHLDFLKREMFLVKVTERFRLR
jgi:hypothetical protein